MTEPLGFCEEPKEVLSSLLTSKENNSMIGITSPKLDPPTLVTVVKEIILDSELLFLLAPFDATGHMLNCTALKFSEIESVLPFTSKFVNPFMKEIEGKTAWQRQLYFSLFPAE
jgi:hypothetical protein